MLLISAAALFAVVYRQTGSQLRDQIEREIRGDATQVAGQVSALGARTPTEVARGAERYVSTQPYQPSSTLLFVVVPGEPTITNHPEVFAGTLAEPGESPGDEGQEKVMGRQLLAAARGFSVHPLPDAGHVQVYATLLQVAGMSVRVGAAEPLAVVERAQHSVATTFLVAGAIAFLIALVASYLAGRNVSAPLRQMAGVAAHVDAGELAPRMRRYTKRADEVRVLAEAFNHMLDRLQEAFAAQREFIADASHELRTPLTVIRGQLEVLAAQEVPSSEEVRHVERLVHAEIARIGRLVDDLLLLAQSERADFLRPRTIELAPFVEDVWDGLSHTAERQFELGPLPSGWLTADPDRVAQALGNLVRNAIDHTPEPSGRVRLEVQQLGSDRIRMAVVDDGPGIPSAELERVFERFHRVDAARNRKQGGAGLGLAIVQAIAEAHGGEARAVAANGRPSGARVEIVLPGYRPA
jgi:two-component system, OmpR family, sensor kinase